MPSTPKQESAQKSLHDSPNKIDTNSHTISDMMLSTSTSTSTSQPITITTPSPVDIESLILNDPNTSSKILFNFFDNTSLSSTNNNNNNDNNKIQQVENDESETEDGVVNNTNHQNDIDHNTDVDQEHQAPRELGVVLANKDMRITHVNKGFVNITGYEINEALGKNCNFLQGPGTCQQAVQTIRDALQQHKSCRVQILNYRKNHLPFWNILSIYPVFNSQGHVDSYVGIQMCKPLEYVDRPTKMFKWTEVEHLQSKALTSSSHYQYEHDKKKSQSFSQQDNDDNDDNDNGSNNKNNNDDDDNHHKLSHIPMESTITFVAETNLPTRKGTYRVRAYREKSGRDVICIISGDIQHQPNVAVRVHDQCFTSEVLGSLKCDCREQLDHAMDYILEHSGVVIYLQQEGRGIGLANKIKVYSLQEKGYDTVDANAILGFEQDYRDYSCVPQVLQDLRISSIRLMTNNPYKIEQLSQLGVKVESRIAIQIESNTHSQHYLHAKTNRMGHFLSGFTS